jgi:SAM-dependent methyltransferase
MKNETISELPFLVDHYFPWRQSRIAKVEKIFGKDFFKNKSILELACGLGHIGQHFLELGAEVTFADGRQHLLDMLKQSNDKVNTLLIDQDSAWHLSNKFDIIIHWGVLYHLDNWKEDLKSTLQHSNLIFLESEVSDSDDAFFEIKVDESDDDDQALHKIGSRPSATLIENTLTELGATFTRYDDSDLNAEFHRYDWPVKNTNTWEHGLRRFWIVKKENNV